MKYYLENETYRVEVKTLGAELSSFYHKTENLEYIWQADPVFWPRHAPVLFPIVGKVLDGQYQFAGKTYRLPQHGFARDFPLELKDQSENKLVFELTHSDKTLAIFPFAFTLRISYTLINNALEVAYQVNNPADEILYFSIGAHPAFNCPLLPNEQFSDYYLEFEKAEKLNRYIIADGLQTGETEPVAQQGNILPLNYALFERDAIVLKGLASERISLKTEKQTHSLDFEFTGFPYFGIWTKGKDAPFICLEPWHGITSSDGDTGELTEKEGIIALAPGTDFNCAYTIRVY